MIINKLSMSLMSVYKYIFIRVGCLKKIKSIKNFENALSSINNILLICDFTVMYLDNIQKY